MRRTFLAFVLGLALAGGAALGAREANADAALAAWAPPLLDTSRRFSAAWCQADAAAVQGLCTPQLWARLAPKFAGGPAAGALGHVETLDACNLVKPTVAWVHVLTVHPDGVQDVATLTFVKVGDQWKVAGGLCGLSP